MWKRVMIISLLLIVIAVQPVLASDLGVESQGFGDRMEVFSGLTGLIADKPTDIQLNPTFLTQVKDKELFTDFYLKSISEGTSKVKLESKLGYRLNEANVLGGTVAFNSETEDYILKVADGMAINDDLAIGGRTGIERFNNDQAQVVLAGGISYQATKNIAVDGRVGLEDEEMNLFIRGKQQLNETEKLVGVINFEQGLDYKRLAIGKNINKENSLLVYGGELIDNETITYVNLVWGTELELSKKLTGRAGGKYRVFYTADNQKDSTIVKIPQIDWVNIGASYQLNELTTLDIACTPKLKFSENSELELSFTLQQKF